MLALALAFLLGGTPTPGRPGLVGRGVSPSGLDALPCAAATSCDLQFVADDWSGSGNWTSRDANAWVAVKTGTLTRQVSSIAGRYEVTGFSATKFFATTANNAHALVSGTSFTYEAIIKFPAGDVASGGVGIVAGGGRFTSGGSSASIYSGGGFRSGDTHARDGTGDYVGAQFGNFATLSRYYLFAWVYDVSAQKTTLYVNGTAQGSQASWSRGAPSGPISIVFDIGAVSSFSDSPLDNGGTILEIVRHRSALDASTISTRAAPFNAVKGY